MLRFAWIILIAHAVFPYYVFADKNCSDSNLVVDYEGIWDLSRPGTKYFRFSSVNKNKRMITTDATAKFTWTGKPLLDSVVYLDLQKGLTSVYFILYRWEIVVGNDGASDSARFVFEDCNGVGRAISMDEPMKMPSLLIPDPTRSGSAKFKKIRLKIWGHQ